MQVREYELLGPTTSQTVRMTEGSDEPVLLRCEHCGAEGPFGRTGPLTDEAPGRTCPGCKQETLAYIDTWIT